MEKYKKIEIAGRGAYGVVHLCHRLDDKKLVIIKQIPLEQMTKDQRQATKNEVYVLSILNHPNIIHYYEYFLEDNALMIVMEYAEGGTLYGFLQQRDGKLLTEDEILKFFTQMLLSLQHVHSKQILHRDLKTQNILLDKKKLVVKLSDFGISKLLISKSKAVTVVGTPCYISPELCQSKPYNEKSDIWALGCVLHEMASLKRTFEAQNLPALILKIMRGTITPISNIYSDELKNLISNMLQLDPNKRPNINQILANPLILPYLLILYVDFGSLPCSKPKIMHGTKSHQLATKKDSNPLVKSYETVLNEVYYWGEGILKPISLVLPSNDTYVKQVSVGRSQKAGVTTNGRLILWEPTSLTVESLLTRAKANTYIPRYLEGQSAVCINHVSCGDLFTACLTDRGILMTFGCGTTGCLGHDNYLDIQQAKIVETLLGYEILHVSCGSAHIMAISSENEVFAWGKGDNGRLGLGNCNSYPVPQLVPLKGCTEEDIQDRLKFKSVHCGIDRSSLITTGCQVLSCGSNKFNKSGLNFSTLLEVNTSLLNINIPLSFSEIQLQSKLDSVTNNKINLYLPSSISINVTSTSQVKPSNSYNSHSIKSENKSLNINNIEIQNDNNSSLFVQDKSKNDHFFSKNAHNMPPLHLKCKENQNSFRTSSLEISKNIAINNPTTMVTLTTSKDIVKSSVSTFFNNINSLFLLNNSNKILNQSDLKTSADINQKSQDYLNNIYSDDQNVKIDIGKINIKDSSKINNLSTFNIVNDGNSDNCNSNDHIISKTNCIVSESHLFAWSTWSLNKKFNIKNLAMGTNHTAILTDCGEIYCIGSNQFGQLGNIISIDLEENQTDSLNHEINGFLTSPLLPDNQIIEHVACGDAFTIAASKDGILWSWGKGSRGRLGREYIQSSKIGTSNNLSNIQNNFTNLSNSSIKELKGNTSKNILSKVDYSNNSCLSNNKLIDNPINKNLKTTDENSISMIRNFNKISSERHPGKIIIKSNNFKELDKFEINSLSCDHGSTIVNLKLSNKDFEVSLLCNTLSSIVFQHYLMFCNILMNII